MPRTYESPTGDAILAVIERDGPVSAVDIAKALGKPRDSMSDALQRLRRPGEKRIHIAEWQEPKCRGRWTPLYVLGAGTDKPEPPRRSHKETGAAYRERRRYELRSRDAARHGRPIVSASWIPGVFLTK